MRTRWLIPMLAITACASTEALLQTPPDASVSVPDPSTESDGGFDAAPDGAEARPCSDCEYFPDVCSSDVLCSNGPFDAKTLGGPLDLNTTINTIRGRSNSDVWAVGTIGAVAHFDGATWTRSDPGTRDPLTALWLRDGGELTFGSPVRVYTRGLGIVDAGAGTSDGGWSLNVPTIPDALIDRYLRAQLGSSWGMPGATWFWTTSFQGAATTGLWRVRQLPSNALEVQEGTPGLDCYSVPCAEMRGIHGASANELWAVGGSGSAILITGAEGDTPSLKPFNTQTWHALYGVWVSSTNDAWAVGAGGTVRHYTGDPILWDVVSDMPTSGNLRAVWGSSSTDIWAVGDAALVLHYDGHRWSRVKIAGLGLLRPDLTTVWVAATGHVWIGGEGVILSLGDTGGAGRGDKRSRR